MATLRNIIKYFEEGDGWWQIKDIVKIFDTGIISRDYPDKNYFTIVNEIHSKNYVSSFDELIGKYYLWQTNGYVEDSYSGFLLIEYGKRGNYLKIEFAC